MPLRDHFRAPVKDVWPWASIHSTWTHALLQQLNQKLLPEGYYALPNVHLGTLAQVDVGTLDRGGEIAGANGGNGGVATAVWAPPQPPIVVAVEFPDLDVFEVRVYEGTTTMHLVAAIELVSPRNKDRPVARSAFAAKCAAYLQQEVGLVVVDVVTDRHDSLHEELAHLLQLDDTVTNAVTSELYAAAYRAIGVEAPPMRLELWPANLAIGERLPVLPLWIAPDRAVPLDLEDSYTKACQTLRMH